MKRGAYLINTARGKICDRDAVARACESGQLAGYAGDVWFPQPAPRDHPWRSMPHHGMTPHISGTSLSAQARYAAGTREILECWFDGRPIREEYLIVDGGKLAGAGAHSYSEGDATGGSEEAARFKSGKSCGPEVDAALGRVAVDLGQLVGGEVERCRARRRSASSCSTLLAPISAEVTRGSRSTQASAICASVWPRRCAISFSARICARAPRR